MASVAQIIEGSINNEDDKVKQKHTWLRTYRKRYDG